MAHNPKAPLSESAKADAGLHLDRHREAVQASMRQAVPTEKNSLYAMLRYHLGWTDEQGTPIASEGGKLLRPTVCLLACEWLGGKWQAGLYAAVALELCHNFSLIHDDIQDGDIERRHRPTVWYLWGQPMALVAGDALLSLADMAVFMDRESPEVARLDPKVALEISRALTQGYLEMVEGQYLDLSFEGSLSISVDDYLDMASRKTGALFECAMSMGALAATGDRETAGVMGRCGCMLGLAFQIRDDVLGIWGSTQATGKAVGSDIRRRKKSLPVVHALAHSRGADAEALQRVYRQQGLSEDDVQQVLEIMDRLATQEFCQRLAEEHGRKALEVVGTLRLEPWATQELRGLVEFVVSRPS